MRKKVLYICIAIIWWLTNIASAQNYFTEGTRWIELRLDTLKYDSWFTEVSQSNRKGYNPNYDMVEYYVQGDSTVDFGRGMTFRYVWLHKEGQPDSIRFVITQDVQSGILSVTNTYKEEYDGASHLCFQYPARLYDFDWQIGKTLDFDDVYGAACTCFPVNLYTFGTIQEIEHGTFGTAQEMEYIDVDSIITYYGGTIKERKQINTKLIRGIGVTSWDANYCLFGPVCPQGSLAEDPKEKGNHRSILVHFERDGDVLYDLWPTPEGGLASHIQSPKASRADDTSVYDLQGRKVEGKPSRGIYIIGGKKRVVK